MQENTSHEPQKFLNNKAGTILLFLSAFILIVIRYCYYGFSYYYQLDDYIQFHDFSARGIDTFAEITAAGLMGSRPVAVLGDMLVWSHFFPIMILAVVIIAAMYTVSAFALQWVWARHFSIGNLFIVIFTLLPLGLEGIYWMSAASRIVAGLFFASAALVSFEKWCQIGRKRYLFLYLICQLLSYGCYEQVLLFSAASVLILTVLNFEKRSRALFGLLSVVNIALYFLFIKHFPMNATIEKRMVFVSPFSNYYWEVYFLNVLKQIKAAFIDGGFYTFAKGFKRGIVFLFSDRNYLYLTGLSLTCLMLYFLTKSSRIRVKSPGKGLFVGLLLFAAPLTIFFVISNSWFSLRGTVTSYCGLAIIIDIAFALLISRKRAQNKITAGVVTLLALAFCISAISEIHDYKETTEKDQKFIFILKTTLEQDGILRKGLNIGILNLETNYLQDQNFSYHEHITGVTSSEWALHGALESIAGQDIPNVSPLPKNPMYAPWNSSDMQIKNFDVLYLYDGDNQLIEVNAVEIGCEIYALYALDGSYFGYTWEEDQYAYLEVEHYA